MNIGEAVRVLKDGGRVAREGWNGKGMNLFLADGNELGPAGRPFVVMYDAQGMFVPWLCSQTDMLAEDWIRVGRTRRHTEQHGSSKIHFGTMLTRQVNNW